MGCDPFSGHADTTQSAIIMNQVGLLTFYTFESILRPEKALLRLVIYMLKKFCKVRKGVKMQWKTATREALGLFSPSNVC